jgi:hypothetical protein
LTSTGSTGWRENGHHLEKPHQAMCPLRDITSAFGGRYLVS